MANIERVMAFIAPENTTKKIPFELISSPETNSDIYNEEGLVLRGHIRNRITGKPVSNQEMHLVISELKNIFFTKSDSLGAFHFNLNYSSGNHKIYINIADTLMADEVVIEVDNDFLPAEVFNTIPFLLDSTEQKLILKRVQKLEIETLFERVTINNSECNPFYGHADKTIVLDDYVDLNTLKEYFKEIPGNVVVKKVKGHYRIRLEGENPQMEFMEPLILLDFVPVYNTDKIISLRNTQIDRYEIVNELYARDSKIFGGILSIISDHGDFAQYKFPASARFVPFTLLRQQNSI